MEVFIKVMNGLVMTPKEDEMFMCLAALLCEQFLSIDRLIVESKPQPVELDNSTIE